MRAVCQGHLRENVQGTQAEIEQNHRPELPPYGGSNIPVFKDLQLYLLAISQIELGEVVFYLEFARIEGG